MCIPGAVLNADQEWSGAQVLTAICNINGTFLIKIILFRGIISAFPIENSTVDRR